MTDNVAFLPGVRALAKGRLPPIVRPSQEVADAGESKINKKEAQQTVLMLMLQQDNNVLPEKRRSVAEFTVLSVENEILPPIRRQSAGTFYDYEADYLFDETTYFRTSVVESVREVVLPESSAKARDKAGGCDREGTGIMPERGGRFSLSDDAALMAITGRLMSVAIRRAGADFPQPAAQAA